MIIDVTQPQIDAKGNTVVALGKRLIALGRLERVDAITIDAMEMGDLVDFRVGAQVGIATAATKPRSAHRARVVAIANGTLSINPEAPQSLQAGGTCRIWSDDSGAIQLALDRAATQQPSEVYLPRGTYPIGIPGFTANKPLKVHTNTRVYGDGIHDGANGTLLLLCDEADQPIETKPGKFQASLLLNANHFFWRNLLPADDENILIERMTLDGNKEHQSRFFIGGGDPTMWGKDGGQLSVRPKARGIDLNKEPKTGLGVQPVDYYVGVTYVDQEREVRHESTISKHITESLSDLRALQIVIERTPRGLTKSVKAHAWIHRRDSPSLDEAFVPKYLRVPTTFQLGPGEVKDGSVVDVPFAYDVNKLEPAPGMGLTDEGAGSAGGLCFERVRGLMLRDLEVRNFAVDGIWLGSNGIAAARGGTAWVKNVKLVRVTSHGNGRDGIDVTGEVQIDNGIGLDVIDCTLLGNWRDGFHLEDNTNDALGPFRWEQFRFIDVRFIENASVGLKVQTPKVSSLDGLQVADCWFIGNFQHVAIVGATTVVDRAAFDRVFFIRSRVSAVQIAAVSSGYFNFCGFVENSRTTPLSPFDVEGLDQPHVLLQHAFRPANVPGAVTPAWFVTQCDFIPTSPRLFWDAGLGKFRNVVTDRASTNQDPMIWAQADGGPVAVLRCRYLAPDPGDGTVFVKLDRDFGHVLQANVGPKGCYEVYRVESSGGMPQPF